MDDFANIAEGEIDSRKHMTRSVTARLQANLTTVVPAETADRIEESRENIEIEQVRNKTDEVNDEKTKSVKNKLEQFNFDCSI